MHVHDSWVAKADGATEVMQIFHNGQMVKSIPISLGSSGHPSHVGPHVISDRKPSNVMDSCTYGVCQGDPGYYKEKVDLDERISNDAQARRDPRRGTAPGRRATIRAAAPAAQGRNCRWPLAPGNDPLTTSWPVRSSTATVLGCRTVS